MFRQFHCGRPYFFQVNRGEIFGFLGANGAGKTTAMRMLCGLSKPTSGVGKVAGFDISREAEQVKKHIGYMSQKFSLYEDLKVWENIRLFAGIYGMKEKDIEQKTDELLERLGFSAERNTLVKSLPLGWKQKLAFSVSIFHEPRIVFLDEPTGGVDPATRRQFWELIYQAADRGITVFVTTHYMDEAEYCNRISIMVDGQIKALDTPARLKQQFGADTMDDVFQQLARHAVRKGRLIMKQFIAFVKKEFYHIFRDRRTMLILLGMPVVQIILFGFAISTEVKNVRLAVLDPSNDVVTRKIIDRLDASEYFTVTRRFHSPREMEAAFLKNKIDMVVVFNEHFADGLYCGDARVQLIVDATDPNMSTSQINYATGIVSAAGQEMISPGISSSARLTPDIKLLYNPQMKSAYNFVPGVMGLILMLICAMMTSISIVREKETGTMEVLLVSPVKPLFIILAKAVPYFVLSFVNLVTILLLSVFVLDVPVVGSLFWLVVVSLLFIFVSLSLGLLISSVTRTQVAAMLASGMILMMPTMVLSGMIFPVESMPLILQLISDIIPARWYIQAVRKLMIEGVSVVLVFKEIGILLLMATVLITVSIKKFKYRLE